MNARNIKKIGILMLISALALTNLYAQADGITDREGNVYQTLQIGNLYKRLKLLN